MNKVAIYTRLSDEDRDKRKRDDESESIQNQKSMLLGYALEKGWDVYKIYCDEDWSGVDNSRPEWNCLIADAEKNKFNIVLCKTQSRFSRDMEMIERYVNNKFLEWNIRFVSIVDNADTEVKGNKKSRQINGLINEWFLEDLSDNIKSVLNNKRNNGKYIGSYEPFGYEKDKLDKNKLIIDPKAASIIKKIFKMYISGCGSTTIAQSLNVEGIPNPSLYKKNKGVPYSPPKASTTCNLWSDATVRGILTNQMYIGDMVQGKLKRVSYKNQKLVRVPKKDWIIIEGTHEAIISKEDFYKVQERFGKNIRPQKNGVINPLAYKIKCENCGGHLHKHKSKGIDYFRCRTNISQHDLCVGHSIRMDKLFGAVLFEINKLIDAYKNDTFIESQIEAVNFKEKEREKIMLERLSIETQIKETSETIKNLYVDKLKCIINEDQFVEFNEMFLAEKDKLTQRLKDINRQIEKLDICHVKRETLKDIIIKYDSIDILTKEIADEFVEYVEVGVDSTKNKTVRVIWRF